MTTLVPPRPSCEEEEDTVASLVVLERLAMRRAAPSAPLLARLDAQARRLLRATSADEATRAHGAFHAALAAAGRHPPLARLAGELHAALAPGLRRALADPAAAGAAARRERAAVGALAAGDVPGAARLLRAEVEGLLPAAGAPA